MLRHIPHHSLRFLTGVYIFRGLTDLTSSGFVVRLDAGDRIWRFEMHDRDSDGSLAAHHHSHICCRQCGRLTCLATDLSEPLGDVINDWIIDEFLLRGR
ncbi:MAG: transcriptional repressor [Planctomycetaceae bacterium]|nr:transcriptional repressor [Planctomycetaceae bacterium]